MAFKGMVGKVMKTIDTVGHTEQDSLKSVVVAMTSEKEYIDRTGIERNANGEEEPHSLDPSLWKIGEAEVDLVMEAVVE